MASSSFNPDEIIGLHPFPLNKYQIGGLATLAILCVFLFFPSLVLAAWMVWKIHHLPLLQVVLPVFSVLIALNNI
jgi:hypothetical protein